MIERLDPPLQSPDSVDDYPVGEHSSVWSEPLGPSLDGGVPSMGETEEVEYDEDWWGDPVSPSQDAGPVTRRRDVPKDVQPDRESGTPKQSFGSFLLSLRNWPLSHQPPQAGEVPVLFVERDEAEIIGSLESDGFVCDAPRLAEIARDSTRTTRVTRIESEYSTGGSDPDGRPTITETEHVATQHFINFLTNYVQAAEAAGSSHDQQRERAEDILENLTFIGEKERQEAVRGIAIYWKSQLRANPNLQLCVIAGVRRGKRSEIVKSGEFLLDSVLQEFTDEEIKEFEGRITTEVDDLTADPEDVKIILLDDWVISGQQMSSTASELLHDQATQKYKSSIEINLVTCPPKRLETGFVDYGLRIPIKSYFRSHQSRLATHYTSHGAYETGAHSSVDYDFEWTYIEGIAGDMRRTPTKSKGKVEMPGLTNIVRPYRRNPLTRLTTLEDRNTELAKHRREKV
ncbi:hypothetical protein KC973_02810 [Candidatus Saccharibacteria bacterium]|nr:hypothetical protein [Candidatus Saccharibacteria bacterium]